jgi:hypothetical protein
MAVVQAFVYPKDHQMNERVIVWGKTYPVEAYQKSKSVWVVSGEYMGESNSVTDATKGAAMKRWREWAQSKGNG